jgi:hypothetical protein
LAALILTLGLQRDRRRFEKQPSQTIVNGAYAPNSVAALVLYCNPLKVPFSSMRDVTVPRSNLTLKKTLQENLIVRKHY